MEIIKKFDQSQISSIDKTIIQASENGKGINWKRTYFLRNPSDGHVAVVSLNFFERIIWNVQKLFGKENYYKFESVFSSKTVKVISPADLEATMQKVHSQVERVLNPTESKTDQPVEETEVVKELPKEEPTIEREEIPETKELPKEEPTIEREEIPETKELSTDKPVEQHDEAIPGKVGSETEKAAKDIINLFKEMLEEKASHEAALETITAFLNQDQDQDANLDQAVEAVDKLYYSEQSQKYIEIAKICFQQGNVDKAIEILRKSSGYSNQESLCKEFAQTYFQQGNFDKAIEILKKSSYYSNQESLCKEFAQTCFQQGNFENAIVCLKILLKTSHDALLLGKEFALYCCRKYKYADAAAFLEAVEVLKAIHGSDLYIEIFTTVAEEDYDNDNLDKAVETMLYLKNANSRANFEDFCLKVAEKYKTLGELDKSREILSEVIYKYDKSDMLLVELSKEYFKKGDYISARELNSHDNNYVKTKAFYIKIAEALQDKGENTEALNTLSMILKHGRLMADLDYKSVAQDFIKEGNFDKALESIQSTSVQKRSGW